MQLFKARLRRVGSSLGVIVPKQAALDANAAEGDFVEVAILPLPKERRARLELIVGTSPGLAAGWKRDRKDRF